MTLTQFVAANAGNLVALRAKKKELTDAVVNNPAYGARLQLQGRLDEFNEACEARGINLETEGGQ